MADQAEERKKTKYAELATTHHFVPLAIEISGVFGSEAQMFFWELGHRIRDESGEPLAYQYLLQRISVEVQRGNAAAVLGHLHQRNLVLSTLSNSLNSACGTH